MLSACHWTVSFHFSMSLLDFSQKSVVPLCQIFDIYDDVLIHRQLYERILDIWSVTDPFFPASLDEPLLS